MMADQAPSPEGLLAQVLGPGMAWRALNLSATAEDPRSGLWPEEAAAVAGAVLKRQREFATGRHAARAALAELCGFDGPIPVAADRSPLWPAGLVGSISHDESHALSVVARSSAWRSIGVDMEAVARFHMGLAAHVCRPSEVQGWLDGASVAEQQRRLACFFCIKEAVYKAQHPVSRAWLDFADLDVALAVRSGAEFTAVLQRCAGPFAAGYRFVGRCAWDGQRSLALIALPTQG